MTTDDMPTIPKDPSLAESKACSNALIAWAGDDDGRWARVRDGLGLPAHKRHTHACRVCGGDGWTDGSAELRRDGRHGDTTCIGCDGSGAESPTPGGER